MKTHFTFECTIPQLHYDAVLALVYLADTTGCEEISSEGDSIRLKAYFATEEKARTCLAMLPDTLVTTQTITISAVPNQDWNAKWRESMKPARIAPSWWVSPEWLPPPLHPSDHWIKIEPKMAFGTGHHESTRLAASALITQLRKKSGTRLLDIGTGSGVLCFVAAALGTTSLGVEIDDDCRENLAENRQLNHTGSSCDFMIGTLDSLKNTPAFDLIVMNMIHTESAPLLGECQTLATDGAVLVWSGILHDEYQAAVDAADAHGFTLSADSTENEWWCGTFTMKNG